MNKGELTSSEFDSAVDRLQLKDSNIEIARSILVDGRKQAAVIAETGLSRQSIAKVLRRIRETHEKYGKPPDGWQRIEICVPKHIVPIINAMVDEAKKQGA